MNNEAATIALEFARVAGAVTSLGLYGGRKGFRITTDSGALITSLDLAGDSAPLQDLIREMRRGQTEREWTFVREFEDIKAARRLAREHVRLLRKLGAPEDVIHRAEDNMAALGARLPDGNDAT